MTASIIAIQQLALPASRTEVTRNSCLSHLRRSLELPYLSFCSILRYGQSSLLTGLKPGNDKNQMQEDLFNDYIHVDGDRYDKMRAAADAAAWRVGQRAAIMQYLIKADADRAQLFWQKSYSFGKVDDLESFLEEEMVKLCDELNESEYISVQNEVTRVWRKEINKIPYSNNYGKHLLSHLITLPLQEVGPYLNWLCNKPCHLGLPGFFILNTPTDAVYLKDILVQALESDPTVKCQSILRAIQWLAEQARRAVESYVVESVVQEAQKAINEEIGSSNPGLPDKGLKLRQIAMICYYSESTLTDNNAADIAAERGWHSKTSGQQLIKKYTEFCELQQGELPADKKALTHLEKDLIGVLNHLDGKSRQNADSYLKRVRKKKQRGL